jgi:succinate dehydrogenase / fumarate reductase flavoprotein subunit
MQAADQRVIIVGGGLAGLSAAVRIAEEGVPVDLFSTVPVKRSHSVCAQGGINACNDVARQQGYSEWMHFDETLYGGDFLNHQPPVYEMTHWAPRIIDLLDRMGVPFNRTVEGNRDLRLFGGSLFKRTHFAGATTGQQLLYALDEQTRKWETAGLVRKYEFWEFLWPIIEDGRCRGIVAQDMRSMEIRLFKADATVIATGGCGLIFGKSTNSVNCNGAAAARCYRAGAWLANPEFIQVHPTAIPGQDKCRLMSESARGEGGRVWVPREKGDQRHPSQIPENERWYFLEEKYPRYGNLVPRDIATREIFFTCQQGHGIGGGRMVYLDCTHLPDQTKKKLAGIFEIYEKFTGDDPREVAMRIFPSVHYTMGGLWTTYTEQEKQPVYGDESPAIGLAYGASNNMMTNIQGLYAFGEVNYQYHGGTRLGANALLSCIFDGMFCGPCVVNYLTERREAGDTVDKLPQSLFDQAVDAEKQKMRQLVDSTGDENPYRLHEEMGNAMTDRCTVVRDEQGLGELRQQVDQWKDRFQRVSLSDTGTWTNQNLSFTRALGDMIRYAEAVVLGSLYRRESRGSHFRPDFPERDDTQFHQTTVASYNTENDSADIRYERIPTPMIKPRARTYGVVEAAENSAENEDESADSSSNTDASS